eukprot:Nitzschia sp. Nitz4//scaffold110_size71422//34185//35525//NITZ4_005871-RA/size71422-processed-gene-0.7-mRNA-1//1//CDS//3329533080//562//frame0
MCVGDIKYRVSRDFRQRRNESVDVDNRRTGNEFLAILPAHVIGQNIASYLDRQTFNALRCTCKEVLKATDTVRLPPWPLAKLPVGSQSATSSLSFNSSGSTTPIPILGAQSISFSSDGSRLVCRSRGGSIRVWHQKTGAMKLPALNKSRHRRSPLRFSNVAISMENSVIAYDGNDKSRVVVSNAVSSGHPVQTLGGRPTGDGHEGAITSVAFSPVENDLLASAATDSTVVLWDKTRQQPKKEVFTGCMLGTPLTSAKPWEQVVLSGHVGTVHALAWSLDGKYLASGGADRIVRVWNTAKVRRDDHKDFCQHLTGHDMVVTDLAFSHRFLVSVSLDMTVRLWHSNSNTLDTPLQSMLVLQLDCEALAVDITSDSEFLGVATSAGRISVWDIKSNMAKIPVAKKRQRTSDDKVVSWKPDKSFPGRLLAFGPGVLATAGRDSCVQLHSL